jgi:uncharacterized RDD family membrane protein YckC
MMPSHHPSFVTRALAITIDIALLSCLQLILYLLLGASILKAIQFDPVTIVTVFSLYFLVFFASFILLSMFYFTVFHAWCGQTIGKMFMGIKVVSEDHHIVSPGIAFLRWCGYLLSLLPMATGFLWSAVDKDHSAWHDKLAFTKVVTVEMT